MTRNDLILSGAIGAGVVATALLAGAAAMAGEFVKSGVLWGFVATAAGLLALPRRVPTVLVAPLVAAGLVAGFGYVFGLFEAVRIYDEFAHALAGFAVAAAVGTAIFGRLGGYVLIAALASFGIAVGALWEVFEYAAGLGGGLGDTIWDLGWDGVGAVAGAYFARAVVSRSTRPAA